MQGSWKVYLTIAIVVVLTMLAFVLLVAQGPGSGGGDNVLSVINGWL